MLRRDRRVFLIAWIVCTLFAILPPTIVVAEEDREAVRIVATESGSYDWEKQLFVARGDVVITAGDLRLQGDLLTMDLASGDLWLEGAVRLVQDDQEFRGQSLAYNLETGQGQFEQARTEVVLPEETGIVF